MAMKKIFLILLTVCTVVGIAVAVVITRDGEPVTPVGEGTVTLDAGTFEAFPLPQYAAKHLTEGYKSYFVEVEPGIKVHVLEVGKVSRHPPRVSKEPHRVLQSPLRVGLHQLEGGIRHPGKEPPQLMAAAVHRHLFEVDRQKRRLSLERSHVVSFRGFPELSGGEREISETPHRTQRHLVSEERAHRCSRQRRFVCLDRLGQPPADRHIDTGRVPLEEFKADKPAEYEDLVRSGRLEEHLVERFPEPVERGFRIFGFIALAVGLILIALIVYSMLFGYK